MGFLSAQISATALEETKVLVWHRDKLKLILMKNPYLHTVFEHIIARDVVRKLTQVTKQIVWKLDFQIHRLWLKNDIWKP